MTAKIPAELEEYIQRKVASGEFESTDQFISEAMRLYREMESRHDQLRKDVQHGIDQIERGEGIELNDDEELRRFFADIKTRVRRGSKTKQTGS